MNERIKYYAESFEMLGDPMQIYTWLLELGQKLQQDPLPTQYRINANRVSRCQYALFVDVDDGRFKAYSDALIASGYAYILVDIFNNTPMAEAAKFTTESFKELKADTLLSLNRTNGFYQMIEIMANKALSNAS